MMHVVSWREEIEMTDLLTSVALTCCDSGVMLMISGVSGVH